MKHVIIIPDRVTSKRLSAVEMARRLSSAGNRITFIGEGGDYKQIEDFDYIRLDLALSKLVSGIPPGFGESRGQGKDPANQIMRSEKQDAVLEEAAHLNPLHSVLEKLSPDILLIDVEAHVYVLAALALNYPVALFNVFFNMRKYPAMPPLHTDIIPGRGLAGYPLMIELSWMRFRLSKFIHNKKDRIKHGDRARLSLFRRYAKLLGLRLSDHVECYQWLIPFAYRGLPTLVLNPKEMEFLFRPHPSTTYVGPMISSKRSNLPFLPEGGEKGSGIKHLLDSYRNDRKGRRLVYCSFGCFFEGSDTAFWKKLLIAFDKTGWDVILAFGNRLKTDSLGEVPNNIHCLEFAPQLDILSVADCAVIHGGMTTVYECILFEVPMLIYPFKVNDQLGTAARALYHQIGMVGNRDKDRPEDIREQVHQAMSDQVMREKIRQMKRIINAYDKNNTVAEAVERIIKKVD